MENFDANKARQIAKRLKKTQLEDVLDEIRKRAENRYDNYFAYFTLSPETIDELNNRGFIVKGYRPNIAAHFTVMW